MRIRLAALATLALALVLPSAALAADNAGTDGVIINGSQLVTLVAGQDNVGAVSARFANSQSTLFCCTDSGVDGGDAGHFVLHAGGVPYSDWGTAFHQVSAPVLTGTGSFAHPWVVTTTFQTGAIPGGSGNLRVVEQVRHINGSHNLRLTFTVTNVGTTAQTYKAFWTADLYVSGSDTGAGDFRAGPPRQLFGIAKDGPNGTNGTTVALTEITPWSHYFEGYWGTATDPNETAPFTYNDTFNPNVIDNGFGGEWDNHTVAALAPGGSATYQIALGTEAPGGNPVPDVAPDITAHPPVNSGPNVAFSFVKHAGDTATVAYECSMDGAPFDLCVSPTSYAALNPGSHTFRVHGINSDGNPGPAASYEWTVGTTQTVHAAVTVKPIAVILKGRGIPVGCTVSTGRVTRCTITVTAADGVVLARGSRAYTGSEQRSHVALTAWLTTAGKNRGMRPAGVYGLVRGALRSTANGAILHAHARTRIVEPTVVVVHDDLSFASGSAALSPTGRSFLLHLSDKISGVTHLRCDGYTDSVGSAASNYALGLARARAVCFVLHNLEGVATNSVSWGEGHPIASNATAAGRAANRRVTVHIFYN